MNNKPIFAPSLMCIDLLNASADINILEKHCGMLHADIIDGHFAPNIALSPGFVEAVKKHAKLPVDVHLMVERPTDFIDTFVNAGADFITVHAETITANAFRTLNNIKASGVKTGVAICPATSLDCVAPYIELVDMLLIMTVDVGYVGQKFIPQMMSKIKQASILRAEMNCDFMIQVDGCIGRPVYKELHDSGANVYVMGTAGLFKGGMPLDMACVNMLNEFREETGVSKSDSISK